MPPSSPPVALTIAGSDNSAGAGAQADLKTFGAHGVYGLTALTCVVAEVPGQVSAVQAVDPDVVRTQVSLCFAAYPVRSLKTGMLYAREVVALVADLCAARPTPRPPLVVDPVMVATSGHPLLRPEAVTAYQERLFPLAALVTPNLDEVQALLGGPPVTDEAGMRAAGAALCGRHGVPFLIKGGHLRGQEALDLLCWPDGRVDAFRSPFVPGVSTHGTGCTFAAAVTAQMARGLALRDAVAAAKGYVGRAIQGFLRWENESGRPVDALNHWVATGE